MVASTMDKLQHGSRSPTSPTLTTSSGVKRKGSSVKFYAVRQGHKPDIYLNYEDCMAQVKGFSNAQFKSFDLLTEAEAFMKSGISASARFSTKTPKFYAVRAGHRPGVYMDWPSAQQQIQGFQKARHKSFSTRAQAQAFVDGQDSPDGNNVEDKPLNKKHRPSVTSEIDESVEPGTGPMPPISEDGFDSRILLNPDSGKLAYKNLNQQNATKMQPVGMAEKSVLKIYTDGSALGNGRNASVAGVGVYFGPKDSRNASEPLKGPRQTNQRAELTAIQRALELAPKDRDVLIFTDSNYSIKCVTEWFQSWRANGWKNAQKRAVENRDLIELILARIEERERLGSRTNFQWVKGHADDPGNVAADSLAVSAANQAKMGRAATAEAGLSEAE